MHFQGFQMKTLCPQRTSHVSILPDQRSSSFILQTSARKPHRLPTCWRAGLGVHTGLGGGRRTVPRLVLATGQSSDLDVKRKSLIIPSGCCRRLGSSIFYLTRTKSQSKTNAPFTKQKRKAVDDKKKQEKNMLWTIFVLLSSYFVFQMKHPYMQIHFCIFWLIAGKIDINISGNGHDINISLARLQLCVCVYVVWKDVYGEFSQQTLLISLWSRVFKNLERIDRKGSGSLRNIPNFKH